MPPDYLRLLLVLSLLLFLLYLHTLHSTSTTKVVDSREDAEESYLKKHFNDSDPDSFEYFKSTPIEIEGRLYLGQWSSQSSEGRAYMHTEDVPGSWPRYYNTHFHLYRGPWESDPYMEMRLQEGCFDYEEKVLYFNRSAVHWDGKMWTVAGYFRYQKDAVTGVISGINSTLSISVDLEYLSPSAQLRPIQIYSLLMSVAYSLVVFSIAKHSHDCSSSALHARKSSLVFMLWVGVYEGILGVWHVKEACVRVDAFYYLCLAALWNGLVVMMVYSRLIGLVWRAQTQRSDFNPVHGVMLAWSYVALVSVTCVVTVFPVLLSPAVVLSHGFLLPQILRNLRLRYRRSLHPLVYWPLSLSRMLFITYHFSCPANFLKHEPHHLTSILTISFLSLQLLFLFLQDRYGVLWFLPKSLRSKTTCPYYKSAQEEAKLGPGDHDCAICMTPLSLPGVKDVLNTSRTLHAPCGHRFHSDCLSRWLDLKPDCPTCRTSLPPVTEN